MKKFSIKNVDFKDLKDLKEIHKVQKGIFGADAIKWDWWFDLIEDNLLFLKIVPSKLNEIIGAIVVTHLKKDDPLYPGDYIPVFFIKENYQRKGYGTFFFKESLKRLRKLMVQFLYLHTKDYNQPALNFYKKFGFKIIEFFEKYYGSGDNSYLLEMKI